MTPIFDETGKGFNIGLRVASGGEGTISRIDGHAGFCVKQYHTVPSAGKVKKLKSLRSRNAILSGVAAMPLSLAFSDPTLNTVSGVFLPYVEGQDVYELYGTRSRLRYFPGAKFNFLIRVACNVSTAFSRLHASGIIVGDVNEQNIKVLSDATVRFIDADSFQLSHEGDIFTSDVGAPIWTPPELHGTNLTGVVRTTNHDSFGLAQLVFLLLFTGRHPFSGRPRANRHLQPDEAIREYAFAFAPEHFGSPLLPPPGCASLDVLPNEIRHFFFRAFLKGAALPGRRPTADEWATGLRQLEKDLVVCSRQPCHIFWKGASACPWCSIVKETGLDMFPASHQSHGNTRADVEDSNQMLRLASARPYTFEVFSPTAVDGLIPQSLPPDPKGFWSSFRKKVSKTGWLDSWLGPQLKGFRQNLANAEELVKATLLQQQSVIGTYRQEFVRLKELLQPTIQRLTSPKAIRDEIVRTATANRRETDLKEFLQTRLIRHASIPDIGSGRTATLCSYGIETAADVTASAVARVSGFGPALTRRLLNWRLQCESKFVFDPTKATSAAFKQELDKRYVEQIRVLKEEAAAIERRMSEAQQICTGSLRVLQGKITQAARHRDQMKVNIALFERRLRDG